MIALPAALSPEQSGLNGVIIVPSLGGHPMFIAMNRFRVAKGSEAAFEHVWLSRDGHLDEVPGFVEFHLLKPRRRGSHALCFPHHLGEPRGLRGVDQV